MDSNQVTPSTFERDDEGVRKQLSSAPVQTQETVLALLKSFTSGEMQLILVRWNSTDIVSTRLSSGRRCFADPRVSEALAWECANMHLGLCGTKPVSIDIEQVPSWIEPSCRPRRTRQSLGRPLEPLTRTGLAALPELVHSEVSAYRRGLCSTPADHRQDDASRHCRYRHGSIYHQRAGLARCSAACYGRSAGPESQAFANEFQLLFIKRQDSSIVANQQVGEADNAVYENEDVQPSVEQWQGLRMRAENLYIPNRT